MVFLGKKNQLCVLRVIFSYSLISLILFCEATDQISKGQTLNDGEFLTSSNNVFELGFFSTTNTSSARYLGVRYHSIQDQAIIWIANRKNPIFTTNGSLTIGESGNLIVRDGNGEQVWSSNATEIDSNYTAILATTGNFILSSNWSIGDLDSSYWQSFNDPTNTFLPDMKVLASSSEENHVFTSWKSQTDPSPGNFTMGVDPRGAPQIVIWNQTRRIWRSGHWNGIFTGIPNMSALTNYQYGFKVTPEEDGQTYITYNPSNPSDLLRFEISWDGYEEQLRWNESEKKWVILQRQPANDCEKYNYCGDFAVCSETDSPKCACMDGFEPRNVEQWRRGNWSGGCKRKISLKCQRNDSVAEDGFDLLRCMKLPDFADTHGLGTTMDDCKNICLQDCSCSAFAVISNIGCMTWSGELIDLQEFEKGGSNLYIRLADSEFDDGGLSTRVIVIIAVSCVLFVPIAGLLLWFLKRKRKVLPATPSIQRFGKSEAPLSETSKGKEYSTDHSGPADFSVDSSEMKSPDLPIFNFNVVAAATGNFSAENKLGQGGFGPVYKGKLPGGEEIAVKRLSKVSGQGLEEFKNEIILIAKLQHRNLVRLLGCCIQGEEKMLLYEYMPNKSLDGFIFDSAKQAILDWPKRFTIIEGIARGLLYLHRDSRLRIIHRDLKASNILLDEDMIPKISDFGMAKIFGGNQNEANTTRVVGTYGYMSPEYAMEGLFSVKSDVYSFGVLVLEIVTGRRNTSFRQSDHVNLINYAWQLWSEGRGMELVNPSVRSSCSEEEALKCIQVGMLCVQDSALHRPTMQAVVLMLESNSPTLPLPRQPTFTSMRASVDEEIYVDGPEIVSSNDLTVTVVVGRCSLFSLLFAFFIGFSTAVSPTDRTYQRTENQLPAKRSIYTEIHV